MNRENKTSRGPVVAPARGKKDKNVMNQKRQLITMNKPKSIISEQYRILKTSIDFSAVDGDLRSIMVTSTNPSEGKSTTIANLAVLYAQQGKKVLLIDADLRKPTVHHTFSLTNKAGLSSVLTNNVSLKEAVHKTDLDNLYVLTSGPVPPNPTDLLDSKAMDKLVTAMLDVFDLVLFDTAPVLPVPDALVLSRKCDGVILVAKSGSTKKESLKKVKESLEKAQARILGVVLNASDSKEKEYYYYYG